jgi:NTP pyrophosphatase (non-canonical NTP hydrolase)
MSELTFDNYQTAAASTAIYPEAGEGSFNALSYAILGLTNEAGEVAGKLKKVWRDKGGVLDDEAKAGIADELSDVLWYIAAAASELGLDMADIADANLDKLFDRMQRGVIQGSGDNR